MTTPPEIFHGEVKLECGCYADDFTKLYRITWSSFGCKYRHETGDETTTITGSTYDRKHDTA